MALAPWGEESKNPPLQIATWDSKGFSPFSIAVSRGFYGLAKIIVDIAHAQYQPAGESHQRYSHIPFNENDTDESDDDSENNLYSELVDEEFTFENLGAYADIVKSNITPLRMLTADLPLWRLPRNSIKQAEHDTVPPQEQAYRPFYAFDQKPWVSLLR